MKLLTWRLCFILAGVFISIGGPQHSRGTMAEMLADPKWVPAHTLMLTGFLFMLAGLILYARVAEHPPRTRRWLRLATIGTALQSTEMVLHTVSFVDHGNLVAGHHTPVLTTHLSLAVGVYPIFGSILVGLVIAAIRDRTLGSPWIGWLGIIGAIGHGAAAPLAIVTDIPWARMLFPLIVLLALWFILGDLWPAGSTVHHDQIAARYNPPMKYSDKERQALIEKEKERLRKVHATPELYRRYMRGRGYRRTASWRTNGEDSLTKLRKAHMLSVWP